MSLWALLYFCRSICRPRPAHNCQAQHEILWSHSESQGSLITHTDYRDRGDFLPREHHLHITCTVASILVKSHRNHSHIYNNCRPSLPTPPFGLHWEPLLGLKGHVDLTESGVSILTITTLSWESHLGCWFLNVRGVCIMKETLTDCLRFEYTFLPSPVTGGPEPGIRNAVWQQQ